MKDNDVDINIDISLCDDFIEILEVVQPIFEKDWGVLYMSEERDEDEVEDEGGYASGVDLNDFLGFDNSTDSVEYNVSSSEGAVPEDWYITSTYSFSDFSELDDLENDDDINSDEGIDPLLTDLKDEKLLELRRWLQEEDWVSMNDIFERIDELLGDE